MWSVCSVMSFISDLCAAIAVDLTSLVSDLNVIIYNCALIG